MDLRDRRCGDRGVVECREHGGKRPPELGLDQRVGLVAGKRRQTVLQQRQILGDVIAQEIGAGRQQLSELDEARPHLGEGGGKPFARTSDGAAAAPDQPGRAQQRRAADPFERKQRVVPRQGQRDAGETGEMADAAEKPEHRRTSPQFPRWRRGQSRQAEWSAAMPPVRLRNRARSSPAAPIISDNALCGGKRRMLSTR